MPSSESQSVPASSAAGPSGGDRSDGELPNRAMQDRALPDRALPDRAVMAASARRVLEAHWRDPGFTCPNASTYRWLWLWDSCFHSVVWAELGEAERAVRELEVALAGAGPDGFVPHLGYLDGSSVHDSLWGRHGWSSITQPPVYGWTVAELDRRGIAVPDAVIERARAGLRFLLDVRRRSPSGLVEIVHPWESGCDHSPRWDDLVDPVPQGSGDPTEGDDTDQLDSARYDTDRYDDARWFERKGVLLTTIERTPAGSPIHNPEFAIGSVAFSAVSAWAAIELGNAIGDGDLVAGGRDLATSLMARWDPVLRTYVDDGPASGRVRTAEGLLPVLIEQRPDIVATIGSELGDLAGLGGWYGPAGVHRAEPTFRAHSYWRGPSWPQIDLLLAIGLDAAVRSADARFVRHGLVRGAWRSGWAEYWDPDDAAPGGAVPQSWSTVAILDPARL